MISLRIGASVDVDGRLFYLLGAKALGDHTVLYLSGDIYSLPVDYGELRLTHKLHGTEDATMVRDPRSDGWVVTGAILEEVQ